MKINKPAVGLVAIIVVGLAAFFFWPRHSPDVPVIPPEVITVDSFVIPKQVIVGADKTIPLGELVSLSISPIEAVPKYLKSSSYYWRIFDMAFGEKHCEKLGDKLIFGSGLAKKKLLVICSADHLYAVEQKGVVTAVGSKTNLLYTVLDIGGVGPDPIPPGPTPPVPPYPPPSPDPVFPIGKYDLSRNAYNWAKSTVSNEESRSKGANALSTSIMSIVTMVGAGTIKTPEEFLKKTAEQNASALLRVGVNQKEWDAFGTALQKYTYGLYSTGKIVTMDDFCTAWTEVSNGLRAIK